MSNEEDTFQEAENYIAMLMQEEDDEVEKLTDEDILKLLLKYNTTERYNDVCERVGTDNVNRMMGVLVQDIIQEFLIHDWKENYLFKTHPTYKNIMKELREICYATKY